MVDTNLEYANYISRYVRTSEIHDKVNLRIFTSKETLNQFLKKDPVIHIGLVSEDVYAKWGSDSFVHQADLLFLLEEDTRNPVGERGVYKYQPTHHLFSYILSVYFEEFQTSLSAGHQKSKLLSFHSALGGTGKTSLSVNLSRQLTLLGYKVFYFNLELVNGTSLFFQSPEDEHTIQLYYYAKEKPELLGSKLDHLIKRDPYNGVDYFDVAVNPLEVKELTGDHVQTILDSLVHSDRYDFIVMDLDSQLQSHTKKAIEVSDLLLWVLNSDVKDFHKTNHSLTFSSQLYGEKVNLEEKTFFILNGYSRELPVEFERFNVPVHVKLPEMKGWKNLTSGRPVTTTSIFPQHILQLIVEQDVEDGVRLG